MNRKLGFVAVAVAAAVALTAAGAMAAFSFGVFRDQQLARRSESLFGVGQPLARSSTRQIGKATALAHPTALVTLADGRTRTSSRRTVRRSSTRSRCGRTRPTRGG
jgi:hypothetical protein